MVEYKHQTFQHMVSKYPHGFYIFYWKIYSSMFPSQRCCFILCFFYSAVNYIVFSQQFKFINWLASRKIIVSINYLTGCQASCVNVNVSADFPGFSVWFCSETERRLQNTRQQQWLRKVAKSCKAFHKTANQPRQTTVHYWQTNPPRRTQMSLTSRQETSWSHGTMATYPNYFKMPPQTTRISLQMIK